jgi:hypothetical protein
MKTRKSSGISTSLNRTCVDDVRSKISQQRFKFSHNALILARTGIAREALSEAHAPDSRTQRLGCGCVLRGVQKNNFNAVGDELFKKPEIVIRAIVSEIQDPH